MQGYFGRLRGGGFGRPMAEADSNPVVRVDQPDREREVGQLLFAESFTGGRENIIRDVGRRHQGDGLGPGKGSALLVGKPSSCFSPA